MIHNHTELIERVAVVEEASIRLGEDKFARLTLTLNYGLDGTQSTSPLVDLGAIIPFLMRACRVDAWEKVVGQCIRVRCQPLEKGDLIVELGHLIRTEADEAKMWLQVDDFA